MYTREDWRIYNGTLVDSKMESRGDLSWTDGRKYVGDYKQDQKHGMDTFTQPDGHCYNGQWEQGKQHGDFIQMKDYKKHRGVRENGRRTLQIKEKCQRARSRSQTRERGERAEENPEKLIYRLIREQEAVYLPKIGGVQGQKMNLRNGKGREKI